MKILKKLTAALMVLPFLAGLTACSEDHAEYTPAEALGGAQVYFPLSAPGAYSLSKNDKGIDVTLLRSDSVGECVVQLSATQSEKSSLQFNVPSTVTFADGETAATISLTFDAEAAEYEDPDTIVLKIEGEQFQSPYTSNSYQFVVSLPAPWIDLGMALYREDLMTTFFSTGNIIYQVPIQEDQTRPGVYRLLNPYGEYNPYNEPGDYDADAKTYMVIHAEDPEHVWVEDHLTTMDWGYGTFFFSSMVANYLANGNDMDVIIAAKPELFGTLVDGIITMPERSMLVSMSDYNDAGLYYANLDGMFAIALPGHDLVTYDYSARASFVGILKGTDESSQAVVDLTLGEDVASAKYVLTESAYSEDVVASAIVDGEIEAAEISKSERVYLPLSEDGKYRVTVVTFDAEGNAQESASTVFEFEAAGSAWASIGMASYTDDIVGPLFSLPAITYDVEVFTNENKPGIYRLKNPYGEAFDYNDPGDWDGSRDYYLEINATNPNAVFIEEQQLGLNWGYGWMGTFSIEPGTLKDGVITFPVRGLAVTDDDGAYYANNSGAFKLVLPGAANAKAHKVPAGKKRVSHNKNKKQAIKFVQKQALK